MSMSSGWAPMHTTRVSSGVGLSPFTVGVYGNVDAIKKISRIGNIVFIFLLLFFLF